MKDPQCNIKSTTKKRKRNNLGIDSILSGVNNLHNTDHTFLHKRILSSPLIVFAILEPVEILLNQVQGYLEDTLGKKAH